MRRAWLLAPLCLWAPAAGAADPPHLAGTIVAGELKVATFREPGSGLVTIGEGERIGSYVVRAIAPSLVRLEGEGQTLLLVPAEAAQPAPPRPIETGGVTFGLVLHKQPPVPD